MCSRTALYRRTEQQQYLNEEEEEEEEEVKEDKWCNIEILARESKFKKKNMKLVE